MIVDDIKQEFPDSKHMYGDFSSEIIKLLDALQNNSIIYEEKNVLKKAVTDKINQLLTYPSFHHLYYIKSFKQLNLLELKKKITIPDSIPLLRLNRAILEEAYLGEIKKRIQNSSFDLNDIENVKSLVLKLQNAILSSDIMEQTAAKPVYFR